MRRTQVIVVVKLQLIKDLLGLHTLQRLLLSPGGIDVLPALLMQYIPKRLGLGEDLRDGRNPRGWLLEHRVQPLLQIVLEDLLGDPVLALHLVLGVCKGACLGGGVEFFGEPLSSANEQETTAGEMSPSPPIARAQAWGNSTTLLILLATDILRAELVQALM